MLMRFKIELLHILHILNVVVDDIFRKENFGLLKS
jgi:hypothetical protein